MLRGTSSGAASASNLFSPSSGVNVAVLGDSISYQNTGGSSILARAIGYINWAVVYSKGVLFFQPSMNFGVSGETSAQILVRTPAAASAMFASNVKFCTITAGTNDASGDVTPATFISNLTQICTILRAVGITPIIIPVLPRKYGTSITVPITAARQFLIQRYNTLIRALPQTMSGIAIADPTLDWTDQTSANGWPIGGFGALGADPSPKLAYTSDGLHPSMRGASWVGAAVWNLIASQITAVPRHLWSQADLYNAANNPSGSLTSNPMMVGTAGTPGTGTTGTVATGYTLQRLAGTTGAVVGSVGTTTVDSANSYQNQTCVCTAPAGSAVETFRLFQFGSANTAIGDQFYAECEVTVSGVTAGSFVNLTLRCSDGITTSVFFQEDSGQYMPDQSWTGVLRTFPLTAAAANVSLGTLQWSIDGTVASAGVTIVVSRFSVHKVI